MPAELKTPIKSSRQHPYPTPTTGSKSEKSFISSQRSDPPSPSKIIKVDDSDDDVAMEAVDDAPYSPAASESDDSTDGSVFEPESDDEIKPKKGKKGISKAQAGKGANVKTPRARPSAGGSGAGGGKGTPWTSEEDYALFQLRYPKAAVSWKDVAAVVGRDAKVCRAVTAVKWQS